MDFWVNKDIRRRAYDLTVFRNVGEPFAASPLVFAATDEGQIIPPTMQLSLEDASLLMTELWNAGVRPAGVGSQGELAAVKYHLEDMRNLFFNKQQKP